MAGGVAGRDYPGHPTQLGIGGEPHVVEDSQQLQVARLDGFLVDGLHRYTSLHERGFGHKVRIPLPVELFERLPNLDDREIGSFR